MTGSLRALLPALLSAALVGAALIVVPGLPHAFEAPKEAVSCLTAGVGLSLLVGGPIATLPRALAAPVLAFLASGVAASFSRELWTPALVKDVVGVLLLVLGAAAFGARDARTQLARVLVIVAATQAALAALQLVLGPVSLHLLGRAPRRAYAFGTLGVPNWVGALAAMALPPALLDPARRRAGALLAALLVVGLVVSGSRGASLAALGALLIVGARGVRRAGRSLLAGAVAGIVLILATGGTVHHGFGSVAGRLLIWRATVEMIAAHPLLGVAPGGFAGAYPTALHAVMAAAGTHSGFEPNAFVEHPHDLVLAVLADRGIVGLLAFLWLVAAVLRLGGGRDMSDWTRAAAGGTLLVFALYGLVDQPLASTPLAMVAWLATAAFVTSDEAAADGTRPVARRGALAVAGIAVAAFGLAALAGERRVARAWAAAARGDRAGIAAAACIGRACDEAYQVRGLAALGNGGSAEALRLLAAASRTRADPDLQYARAVALARMGEVNEALGVLDWLAVTLPPLTGPHVVSAEVRRAAGIGGIDGALARALALARDSAPNPRLDVFVALAAARRRDRGASERTVPLILVDAGHGGASGGAHGNGVVEKDLTLQLAKPLAAALRARGARVVLTRSRDRIVPLPARAQLANALGPDLFLSLHANAAPDPAMHGIEFHVRSAEPGRPVFPDLSVRDRALLVNVLPDAFARAARARSTLDRCALEAAAHLTGGVAAAGETVPTLHEAPFYLLRQVQAPSVLLEVGYLTSPADAGRLRRPSYRRILALRLADGAMRAVAVPCRP